MTLKLMTARTGIALIAIMMASAVAANDHIAQLSPNDPPSNNIPENILSYADVPEIEGEIGGGDGGHLGFAPLSGAQPMSQECDNAGGDYVVGPVCFDREGNAINM